MKKLILMVGIPGAGKSTWIKNHFILFSGYTKVVSRDEIRFSLIKDDEDYFSHETEVYNKFVNEIKDGLENCDTTIADATHLNEHSRVKLLRALGSTLQGVSISAIVMKTTLSTALKRNDNRTGREFVPREQIRRMYYSMTIPTEEEGFNEVIIVKEKRN